MTNSKTLTELANEFGSDKGTIVGDPHRYTQLYDLILFPYRFEPINFLELGLAVGGPEVGGPTERTVNSPSVQMWLAYFTKAHIFGFDISDFSHLEQQRFTFIRGDSGSESDILHLATSVPSLDIVIDDASHASYHQQLALKTLFHKISPGGLYIVEDLHWQSPFFQNSLPSVPTTAECLISYFEHERYIENDLLSRNDLKQMSQQIVSFSSFPAFDGSESVPKLIVLRKSTLT